MTRSHTSKSSGTTVLVIAAVVLTLYFAQDVLIPLAFALIFSFLLTPLVAALERGRLPRIAAVILVMLIAIASAAGVAAIVASQLLDVANDLPQYRLNIHNKIGAIHAPTGGPVGRAIRTLTDIGKEISSGPAPAPPPVVPRTRTSGKSLPASPAQPTPVQVVEAPDSIHYLRDYVMPALKPLAMAGAAVVFTIFMLIQREDFRNRLLRLAGLGQLHVMTEALDDGGRRLSRYLLMQFLVNGGYGAVFSVGLFFIGVPNAVLWGVIAALLRIVPYVGTLISTCLPMLLAFAVFDSWWPVLLVAGLYAVLEMVVGNFLEPWLYGSHIGISALALLATTIFWTLLWGWPGLILSTPLSVCVILLGRYVPQLSFLHILLGDEVALVPEAQFYQRLLAMDQAEARHIAEVYVKGKPLVELYDTVVLPALTLAEQDRHKGSLDETREAFLFLSVNELIAEFAGYKMEPATPEVEQKLEETPTPVALRVFCIPASDQADEISAAILAQLLEQQGFSALAFPADSPWEDALKNLELGAGDVVCISALPPFAFAQARAACQRLRGRQPGVRVMVGVWGFSGDLVKAQERFGSRRPDVLLTSLTKALEQIAEWQMPPKPAEPSLEADPVAKPA